jgi:hypothetical protein
VVETAGASPDLRIESINADLRTARRVADRIEFAYQSSARCLVVLNRKPAVVEVDGETVEPQWLTDTVLALPRGQHLVSLR